MSCICNQIDFINSILKEHLTRIEFSILDGLVLIHKKNKNKHYEKEVYYSFAANDCSVWPF